MSNNSAFNASTLVNGFAGQAQTSSGITTKAFVLNLATGLGLFTFQVTGFFLLKSSGIGRRIYQPKTYLVQDRLRVEAVPVNPLRWIRRIFAIKPEELQIKCGLDGYFFIRFIRAMLFIFVPLMVILVIILMPVNYHGGRNDRVFTINGRNQTYGVRGLDTLSWQNVAPTETDRYWAHLVCALLAIGWTLYRIYREKLHFTQVRHRFLTSPEHRLKASARTLLVTNIPKEYRSNEALEALFDVFVDNDDRSKLYVWVNRDYKTLRALVARRTKLRNALEKEELRILRAANKIYRRGENIRDELKPQRQVTPDSTAPEDSANDETDTNMKDAYQYISTAFEADCRGSEEVQKKKLKSTTQALVRSSHRSNEADGSWKPAGLLTRGSKTKVPKTAWLRSEVARLTVQIEELLPNLDDETRFPRQNSAFIQFERQLSAHMASALVSHNLPGRMTPRYIDVAPHEILWPNMGLTSLGRFVRSCIASLLFVGLLILWGIPATFLGLLSQLESLRYSAGYLAWLVPWPSWIISFLSGPISALLLALLIQLLVPALCRKLAVLVGTPTRSRREVVAQSFYFTFLFIELVLVTSISSGLFATVQLIFANPTTIPSTLATNLPKAANYFFNYLIIQALAFTGSILFQYLRLLYITLIWPWFTQTPRQEAWLQTTIPHQMWGNVYPLFTNFAAIGLIYSVLAPLMLVFISVAFSLFWIAYRHNYYYVQRNKVDTHGLLFENALSQLFAGVYVLEITLIGLFFLVRDLQNNVACLPQAIIMIIALVLTAALHYVMEQSLSPLYELLPVTLEDSAVEAERQRFLDGPAVLVPSEETNVEVSDGYQTPSEFPPAEPDSAAAGLDHGSDGVSQMAASVRGRSKRVAGAAANARKVLQGLHKQATARSRLADHGTDSHEKTASSRRREVEDQLGAAIAGYPDELTDLSRQEQDAELKAAYQDPVTREPMPVVWIPQDEAGLSEDVLARVKQYGRYLEYSNAGAYLTRKNKCEIVQPAPDVRSDWMMAWNL